jgi:hypothetical protein
VPVDQLHHEVRVALVLTDVEDRHHVGVDEGSGVSDLPHEPFVMAAREARLQALHRHAPGQLLVVGLVDLAHPAVAHGGPQLVAVGEHRHARGYYPR